MPYTMRSYVGTALLILLLTACAGPPSGAGNAPTEATVTPLPGKPTRIPIPTSAPTATVVAINQRQEVIDANTALTNGEYEQAINLLTQVYSTNRENTDLRILMGQTYFQWGQSLVAASEGNLLKIGFALDHFYTGVAVAPPGSAITTDLSAAAALAEQVLEATNALTALRDATQNDPGSRRADAEALITAFDSITEQQSDYPGVQEHRAEAYLIAGQAYLSDDGSTGDTKIKRLEQARVFCTQAAELNAANEAASVCAQQASQQLQAAQQPTPVPYKLVVVRINQNDDRTCLSMGITGTSTRGWTFSIDGVNVQPAVFDGGGNARICGLGNQQQVTFTVRSASGAVTGGKGIPARGGDIFQGRWVRQ